MSQKLSLIRILALVLMLITGCVAWGQSRQKKREVAYETARQSYSDVLKPGMTRTNVEDYLRSKGVAFEQLCCIDEMTAFADLVKIGKEKHPWYCSEHAVYIAFQFAAVETERYPKVRDSDTLKTITIFHHLEGCL
jgi:hypothetical protein